MVCIVECIWHYQQTPTGIASKFGHSSIDICGAANFYPDQLHGILTGQRFQGTKESWRSRRRIVDQSNPPHGRRDL
jgi:hypothetical protein